MDFAQDGPAWPHSTRSRLVEAAGLRWHVQAWPRPAGAMHDVLLLHGTGASTHSWRDVAPRLAEKMGVWALDLPGHAFSSPAPQRAGSLPGMAAGVRTLLHALGAAPDWIVGHSAGAAIAVQMALDDARGLRGIVSLNGALVPLDGAHFAFFSPLARMLALNPLVPRVVAWQGAHGGLVSRLLDSTGSVLDGDGQALYRQLVSDPAHVQGALAMMARWDLHALEARLGSLTVPLHLVTGSRDATVPPADAMRVRARVRGASWTSLPGLGHLAHEEQPAEASRTILALIED
jgi:magnesium chelatase accessory protein